MIGRDPEAGFSLVEIMIVLVVLGVMSGAVMISLGAVNRGAQPETEAKLFASRLSLAVDEALVTDQLVSVAIDPDGYDVQVSTDGGRKWVPHPNRLLGDHHDLASGIAITTDPATRRISLNSDASTTPFSVSFRNTDGGWRVTEDGFAAHTSAIVR